MKSFALLAIGIPLIAISNPLALRAQTVLIGTDTTIDAGTTIYDDKSLLVSNCVVTLTSGVHPFSRVLLTNSSSFELVGGTIQGAVIDTANDASFIASRRGTLDGVTVNGKMDVGNTYSGANLAVANGLVLNGTALVGNPSDQNIYGYIYFEGSQTLGGTGTVLFGASGCNALGLFPSGNTLTIGPGITIRGQRGSIGHNSCLGLPQEVAVVNQGTVMADVAGGTISIGAQPFRNLGLVSSPAGTLTLSGTYDLAGGSLNVGISSLLSFGNITFLSPALLGGTFSVSITNGFMPNAGDAFAALNYPSATNSFTCFGGLDLGGGILLQPRFGQTQMSLRAAAYTNASSQPQLFVDRSPDGVIMVWPHGFPNWTLQSTTNLLSPVWRAVSNACPNQADIPASVPQRYFRLNNVH